MRGAGRGKYGSIFQSIMLILREEGAFAFWKGLIKNILIKNIRFWLLGHIPAQGLSAIYGLVQFTTFEMLSHHSKRLKLLENSNKTSDFLCGAFAGCAAVIFF